MDDKQIVSLFKETRRHYRTGNKYGRLLSKLAYNILNDHSDSEECVNDTWLGIWNTIHSTIRNL